MIIFLCGEMGVGKNCVAQCLANSYGCSYVDGDNFIRDSYSRGTIRIIAKDSILDTARNICEWIKNDKWVENELRLTGILIVCQGLYSHESRKYIEQELAGYEPLIVWVKAPFFQHMKRLWRRSPAWILFWLLNTFRFDRPRVANIIYNEDNMNLSVHIKNP